MEAGGCGLCSLSSVWEGLARFCGACDKRAEFRRLRSCPQEGWSPRAQGHGGKAVVSGDSSASLK